MSENQRPVFDFVVDRGDSLTIELGPVTVKDKDGVAQPVDLTAADALYLTVKRSTDDTDADAVVQLTKDNGITADSPATTDKNYATAFIGAGEFDDNVVRTEYQWDAELQIGDRVETFSRGRIIVVPDVTRT